MPLVGSAISGAHRARGLLGALGADRQELAGGPGGPGRQFRSAGTGRCRQPSGTGTAGHESARSSRPGRRYDRLMNDSSRPPLPVSATSLLRYSVVAEVEAPVLRGWPARESRYATLPAQR